MALRALRGKQLCAVGGSCRDTRTEIADEWSAAALDAYRSLLERNPGDTSLWIRVADIEASLGNLDASISALQSAAQHAPQDAMLHQRLSQALAFADRPQAALDAIERALTLKPDEPEFSGQGARWQRGSAITLARRRAIAVF